MHEHFSTAVKFGHSAFEHLGKVYRKYQSMTPEKYAKMDSSHQTEVAQNLVHQYIIATHYFQFMMEAVIHHFYYQGRLTTLQEDDEFTDMWRKAFKEKKLDPEAVKFYLSNFYQKIRLEIIHSKHPARWRLPNFRFKNLYLSFQAGWRAYQQLSEAVGFKHDPDSWKIMCELRGLPEQLDESQLLIDDILDHEKYQYEAPPLNFITLGEGALQVLTNIYSDYLKAEQMDTCDPGQAFVNAALLSHNGKEENYLAIFSIVLFHSMVECVTNCLCDSFGVKTKKMHTSDKLQFLAKEKLGIMDQKFVCMLENYIKFYDKYRHGFLHPKTDRNYTEFIDEYHFRTVYHGFQCGWTMLHRMLEIANIKLPKRDIPKIMPWGASCKAFGLPYFPDESISRMGGRLSKLHLDHINQSIVSGKESQDKTVAAAADADTSVGVDLHVPASADFANTPPAASAGTIPEGAADTSEEELGQQSVNSP